MVHRFALCALVGANSFDFYLLQRHLFEMAVDSCLSFFLAALGSQKFSAPVPMSSSQNRILSRLRCPLTQQQVCCTTTKARRNESLQLRLLTVSAILRRERRGGFGFTVRADCALLWFLPFITTLAFHLLVIRCGMPPPSLLLSSHLFALYLCDVDCGLAALQFRSVLFIWPMRAQYLSRPTNLLLPVIVVLSTHAQTFVA